MNIFTSLIASPFLCLRPNSFSRLTLSRAKASRNIATRMTVARAENAVEIRIAVNMLGCNIQSHECLACARDTRYKTDGFVRVVPGGSNDLGYCIGSFSQIDSPGITPRDIADRVTVIQCHRCLDDCRRGLVSALLPSFQVD